MRFYTEEISPIIYTYPQYIGRLYLTYLVCSSIQSMISEGKYLYTYKIAGSG